MADNLDAKLESERASEHEFQELPYHFHEISDLLFRECGPAPTRRPRRRHRWTLAVHEDGWT
jgi:hypothetical protein